MTLHAAIWGLVLGAIVTDRLHASHGFWGRRIGRSRFRRANLPVGGAVALLAAGAGLGGDAWTGPLLAAGLTMALAAIGWRYLDPLPRAYVHAGYGVVHIMGVPYLHTPPLVRICVEATGERTVCQRQQLRPTSCR